jgi:hypothetical protein
MSRTLYLLVGAPGSGKTWVCSQLEDKFHVIHHDGFVHLKEPGSYIREILKEAPAAEKPVIIEAPFSVSQTVEPLENRGYKVVPIFIIEDERTHSRRYIDREKKDGRWSDSSMRHLVGHLTRTKTYLQRAVDGGHFHGTSGQVLEYMKKISERRQKGHGV